MDHDDTQVTDPGGDVDAHRIAPAGELDIATIDPVREDVKHAIAHGATVIVFDLSAVTFIDSSALAVFAYAARQVARVHVTNPNEITRRVIEQTGLIDVLHVEP
jgi:anti-sigma B factor antagonist